jgi:hypothetical protein
MAWLVFAGVLAGEPSLPDHTTINCCPAASFCDKVRGKEGLIRKEE